MEEEIYSGHSFFIATAKNPGQVTCGFRCPVPGMNHSHSLFPTLFLNYGTLCSAKPADCILQSAYIISEVICHEWQHYPCCFSLLYSLRAGSCELIRPEIHKVGLLKAGKDTLEIIFYLGHKPSFNGFKASVLSYAEQWFKSRRRGVTYAFHETLLQDNCRVLPDLYFFMRLVEKFLSQIFFFWCSNHEGKIAFKCPKL